MTTNGNIHPGDPISEEGAIREYAEKPLCPSGSGVLGVGILSAVFIVIVSVCVADSIHKVTEGNVGIYYKQGALMNDLTDPGIHHHAPFITE